jgi:hypothetical protein
MQKKKKATAANKDVWSETKAKDKARVVSRYLKLCSSTVESKLYFHVT